MALQVSKDSEKFKKHNLHIDRETGLDGKVRSIRLDQADEAAGVQAYGNPKNKIIDSRKVEKSEPIPVLRGDPRGGRFVDQPEQVRNKQDGELERVPITKVDSTKESTTKPSETEQRSKVVKLFKRSTQDVDKNQDLDVAEAKVFRPLFVYRQQMNRRKAQKQKKKAYYPPKKYDPRVTVKPRPVYYYPQRGVYSFY